MTPAHGARVCVVLVGRRQEYRANGRYFDQDWDGVSLTEVVFSGVPEGAVNDTDPWEVGGGEPIVKFPWSRILCFAVPKEE